MVIDWRDWLGHLILRYWRWEAAKAAKITLGGRGRSCKRPRE